MEIWNQIRCRKVSLLTAPHFQVRGVGQDMKQTYLYLWYPLFQAQWDRCYKLEHVDDISFREITPIILESKCGNRMWKYSIKKED
jgi:hypothetical protein